ncbi:MAG: restriction endonuclease, partial [Candidatus Altiarchaeota archaeon]|nr:restriction endonuclease [Candidatus Altiarchaeota archaeon]
MVDEINTIEFKDVIEKFIKKMGFDVESATPAAEGVVDFRAITRNPVGARVVSLIRASTTPQLVKDEDVLNLYRRMSEVAAVRAAYITTSGFSDGAVETAKDKPISLINKYQLIDSLEKRGLMSDKELMDALDTFGMAEKHFQGVEQSFVTSQPMSSAAKYFEAKAGKKEKVLRIAGRYAPLEIFKIQTFK